MKGFGKKSKTNKREEELNSFSKTSKEILINRAFELHAQGNILEAEKYYKYLLDQELNHPVALCNYGVICKQMGRVDKAIFLYKKSIHLFPKHADAYSNLGNILKGLEKYNEARIYCLKAIEINPNYAEAYSNLGSILRELREFTYAESCIRKAILIMPNLINAHVHLGNILMDQGKLKEAEESQRKAIKIKPDHAEAHLNLGNILMEQGKLKEAEESQRKAIQIKPDYTNAYLNIGVLLRRIGKLDEAEIATRKAIDLDYDCIEAHYNLSFILLKLKKFEEGWNKYEWRWKIRSATFSIGSKLETCKPEWNPSNRGRVLLWAEQGIGDEILFASLVPQFINLVDKLIIKTDKRLIPLLKRSFSENISYISKDEEIDEQMYDFHIAMGSLPKYLRKFKQSFVKYKHPYLKVDGIKRIIIKNKLDIYNSKKIVGISWKSSSKVNKTKSLSLEEFILGIYSPNICFVSLQYGEVKDEVNYIRNKYGINIIQIEEVDNFNNIDDLGALIKVCDLVVSIEIMTFALAGALGVKSNILLSNNCHPFNGYDDSESYWFESQKFFRQSLSGDWVKAFNSIKDEIISL